MVFKKGDPKPKNSGKTKGTQNKATTAAREAIAAFVDSNTPRLERLLDKIEKGTPKVNDAGEIIGYTVDPDPKGAFDAITKVMEYYVPKLARVEQSGVDGKPVAIFMNHAIQFSPNSQNQQDDDS